MHLSLCSFYLILLKFFQRLLDLARADALCCLSGHVVCNVFLVGSHCHFIDCHCYQIHRLDAQRYCLETTNKILTWAIHKYLIVQYLVFLIHQGLGEKKVKPVRKSDIQESTEILLVLMEMLKALQVGVVCLEQQNLSSLFVLQTNPTYLAKLIFQMPQNKSTKFMDTVIFTLYNYASNQREEYLLLKLFKTALEEEIKYVKFSEFVWQTVQ